MNGDESGCRELQVISAATGLPDRNHVLFLEASTFEHGGVDQNFIAGWWFQPVFLEKSKMFQTTNQ